MITYSAAVSAGVNATWPDKAMELLEDLSQKAWWQPLRKFAIATSEKKANLLGVKVGSHLGNRLGRPLTSSVHLGDGD